MWILRETENMNSADKTPKSISMEAIIFDIDGTLSDATHRRHLVENGNNQWDAFFKAIPDDPPIVPIVDLARSLIRFGEKAILFATGRPERTRKDTLVWLTGHGLEIDFQSRLFMRNDDDKRPDHIVKRDILDQMREAGFVPILVFDDRQSVVDMWRREGIRVAQTAPGNLLP